MTCAPEEAEMEETIEFYKKMQIQIDKTNRRDSFIVTKDLNARVDNVKVHRVVGTNGKPALHQNGQSLMDLTSLNRL